MEFSRIGFKFDCLKRSIDKHESKLLSALIQSLGTEALKTSKEYLPGEADYYSYSYYKVTVQQTGTYSRFEFMTDGKNQLQSKVSTSLPLTSKGADLFARYVRAYLVERDRLREIENERKRREIQLAKAQELRNKQDDLRLKLAGAKSKDADIAKAADISVAILEKGKRIHELTNEVDQLRKEGLKLINR